MESSPLLDMEPRCDGANGLLNSFLPGLSPINDFPPDFWRPELGDLFALGATAIVTLVIWVIMIYSRGYLSVVAYWDGPNYIYAGMTLYHIPPDYLWQAYFEYPPYYFACHLPGFPLAIRLFSTILFNRFVAGTHLAIFVISLLGVYVFRRLLLIYDAVKDPTLTSILLSIVPIRYVLYHTVAASEPLFLLYCYLAFIFLKTNRMIPLFLSICGATVTRIEGLAIWGTVGLCYLLRLDLKRAIVVGFTLIAPLSVMGLHRLRFGDWLAYIHFNQGHNSLIQFPPFHEPRGAMAGSQDTDYIISSLSLFLPFIIGTILVFPVCVPFGIFSFVYVWFTSLLFHLDLYRYAIPGCVFAFLVGFDEVWSSQAFTLGSRWFIPCYLILVFWYAVGQVGSNVAGDWFVQAVLETPLSYI
jgi:hypothetical protein